MIQERFQQGSEGVQRYQNSLHFKFFPISVEGGVIENQFFPKFKKSKLSQGGRGSRKLWTFSTNYGIFYFQPSPYTFIKPTKAPTYVTSTIAYMRVIMSSFTFYVLITVFLNHTKQIFVEKFQKQQFGLKICVKTRTHNVAQRRNLTIRNNIERWIDIVIVLLQHDLQDFANNFGQKKLVVKNVGQKLSSKKIW